MKASKEADQQAFSALLHQLDLQIGEIVKTKYEVNQVIINALENIPLDSTGKSFMTMVRELRETRKNIVEKMQPVIDEAGERVAKLCMEWDRSERSDDYLCWYNNLVGQSEELEIISPDIAINVTLDKDLNLQAESLFYEPTEPAKKIKIQMSIDN